MNLNQLDQWVRGQDFVTTDAIRQAMSIQHVGGSTWIQIARVLRHHGFERAATGWERKRPSPDEPCPSYRQLQQQAAERKARCKAAMLKEKKPDPTLYDPIHRDPTVQDPAWADKKP